MACSSWAKGCVPTMAIKFVLLVNKQGQTRVAQYYEYKVRPWRELTRACVTCSTTRCHFGHHRGPRSACPSLSVRSVCNTLVTIRFLQAVHRHRTRAHTHTQTHSHAHAHARIHELPRATHFVRFFSSRSSHVSSLCPPINTPLSVDSSYVRAECDREMR